MTTDPNHDETPDTEGRTLPPYEGRRESADLEADEGSTRDGVRTGGATGPVEDPDLTGPNDVAGTGRGEDQS
jgi:hypothetical protein